MYSNLNGQYMVRYLDRFSVFVGNLQNSTSEAEIYVKFGLFGTIINVHLISKQNKRAFAFIRYEEEDAAFKAIHAEVRKNRFY